MIEAELGDAFKVTAGGGGIGGKPPGETPLGGGGIFGSFSTIPAP
ncbi:hypothetical protein FB33_2664, partial [Cutibacterium acnes]